MGARSRRKGAAWELEVCRRIIEQTGSRAVRNLEETRDGNTGDIHCEELPISWQCKVGARPDIYGAVKEATSAAGPGQHPVAVIKRNGAGQRKPDELAVLPLEDFLEIIGTLCRERIW